MRVLSLFFLAVLATVLLAATTLISAGAARKIADFKDAAANPYPASCYGPGSGKGSVNCGVGPNQDQPVPLPPPYTDAPKFVRSVKNGKLYTVGTEEDSINVIHLYSSSDDLYTMGLALGQLMPNEVRDMFTTIEPWLISMLEKSVPWLPKWLAVVVVEKGAPAALELLFDVTKPYIPKEYLQEWQGIADGAGVPLQKVYEVSLFPQASKAACTAFSAVGPAAAGKGAVQLRCLDFEPHSHVSDFSSIVVYHYNKKPMLANIGYLLLTGCLTCASYDPVTGSSLFAGEKDWGWSKDPIIPYGFPWMMVFRKSMEETTLQGVQNFIDQWSNVTKDGPWDTNTVAIHLLYTEGKTRSNVGFEIGYNHSQKFEWNTPQETPAKHPERPGAIYWTKNSGVHTNCTVEMFDKLYGEFDINNLANYWSPADRTGDTQVTSFSAVTLKGFVANSRKTNVTSGSLCAYYRQRNYIDFKALYDEKQ